MWQYNYTDSNNELYHWKYKYKKRINGKWRYYYDNDSLGIKNFIDTKITGNAQKQAYAETVEKQRLINIKAFETKQDRIHTESIGSLNGIASWNNTDAANLKAKETMLNNRYNNLKTTIKEFERDYDKTLAGATSKNVKSLIDAGKMIVNGMVKKISNKKYIPSSTYSEQRKHNKRK